MRHQRYVSSELTNFVGRGLATDDERYALLTQILREGQLVGRHDTDHPSGGGFTLMIHGDADPLSNSMYIIPMVCFCDIPPDDFGIHMKKYSNFGVAFGKSFLIGKGVRPVFYVPKPIPNGRSEYVRGFQLLSNLHNAYTQLTLAMGPNPGKPSPCTEEIRTLFSRLCYATNRLPLNVLSFIKFFDGLTTDEDPLNYYMEREWRMPGTISCCWVCSRPESVPD